MPQPATERCLMTGGGWEIVAGDASFYHELALLWAASVRATHYFLRRNDFLKLRKELPAVYLPSMSELWVARTVRVSAGFLGCAGNTVGMLFVRPEFFNLGVGTSLLLHAGELHGCLELDVNEQNTAALNFYTRRGFRIISYCGIDGEGRNYPLLHLRAGAISE